MKKVRFFLSVHTISAIILLGSSYVIWQSAQTFIWMNNTKKLVIAAEKFEQTGSGDKWLIIGDSLAYGVGATSAENSIAGNIAKAFPDASIDNKSESGARVEDVAILLSDNQLVVADYDFVVVVVGGNDVVRLRTDMGNASTEMRKVIGSLGQTKAESFIITMTTPNNVSIVHDSFKWLIEDRFNKLQASGQDAAHLYENVNYLDVSIFNKDVYKSLEANDRFHLNDEGYKKLTDRILAELTI